MHMNEYTLEKAIITAINVAYSSSKGRSKYENVSACKKCIPISHSNLFYRFDEIAKWVREHPNQFLLIADTYYLAYTKLEDVSFIVIVGGNENVNSVMRAFQNKLADVVGFILKKGAYLELVGLLYTKAHEFKNTAIVVFRFKEVV